MEQRRHFSRWGLEHASALVFLFFRCAIALALLTAIGLWQRRLLPDPGSRWRVALIGLLMIGGYQIAYLLALEWGITPGVLATLLGVQPIITQFVTERRCGGLRGLGLLLALGGLTLVVYQSIRVAHFSPLGIVCAFIALGCMTLGTLLQKACSSRRWRCYRCSTASGCWYARWRCRLRRCTSHGGRALSCRCCGWRW
ncbi:hypothetical protein GGER_14290 [Serratia rubidaea]